MTRFRLKADGTRVLLSWSFFGPDDKYDEALRRQLANLDESNRRTFEEWERLTPEERERRLREDEERKTGR
jgi:hypothetical protein